MQFTTIYLFKGFQNFLKRLANTNVHDDGSSPYVMKALATESRRHRGKAFFLFSVPLWQFSFTAKRVKVQLTSHRGWRCITRP